MSYPVFKSGKPLFTPVAKSSEKPIKQKPQKLIAGPKGMDGAEGRIGFTGAPGRDARSPEFKLGKGEPMVDGEKGDIYLDHESGDIYKWE